MSGTNRARASLSFRGRAVPRVDNNTDLPYQIGDQLVYEDTPSASEPLLTREQVKADPRYDACVRKLDDISDAFWEAMNAGTPLEEAQNRLIWGIAENPPIVRLGKNPDEPYDDPSEGGGEPGKEALSTEAQGRLATVYAEIENEVAEQLARDKETIVAGGGSDTDKAALIKDAEKEAAARVLVEQQRAFAAVFVAEQVKGRGVGQEEEGSGGEEELGAAAAAAGFGTGTESAMAAGAPRPRTTRTSRALSTSSSSSAGSAPATRSFRHSIEWGKDFSGRSPAPRKFVAGAKKVSHSLAFWRNVIMVKADSVSNDDLHCQSLLGVNDASNVRHLSVPCSFARDRRYVLGAGSGGSITTIDVSEDGVYEVENISGVIRFTDDEPPPEDWTKWDAYASAVQNNLALVVYVPKGQLVHVPVLCHGSNCVVDLRPNMGIVCSAATPSVSYKEVNSNVSLTTQHLYEKITIERYLATDPHNDQLKYRKAPGEPAAHVSLLGAAAVEDAQKIWERALGEDQYSVAVGRFDNDLAQGDCNRGSIPQLTSRYGVVKAGTSVLGFEVPFQVIKPPGDIQWENNWSRNIEPHGSAEYAYAQAATAHARVAPLAGILEHSGAVRQTSINSTGDPPSLSSIASRMSRGNKRNVIGVAMQKMDPGKPGDVLLYDHA